MAYTTINKSTDYFNTLLYTGTGSALNVTGVGFDPDWIWTKCRSDADQHELYDKVRGATKRIRTNSTDAENTESYQSFISDGFAWSGTGNQNTNGRTYASWNWKANGAGSSNTDGTITSTVSANTTAGFSVGTYTANATAGATVGHGLGVAPDMLIVKVRNNTNNWAVYHESVGATKALYLDSTSGETTDGWMNNTAPSSSVFTLSGGNYGNASGYTVVFYAFAEKKGYSKFGSYTGNGNANGTFIYTGFKPSFVMTKRTDSTSNWYMMTGKASDYSSGDDGVNPLDRPLFANLTSAENNGDNRVDFLSNGFKFYDSGAAQNGSGATNIYMAFGQSLVGSNNVPCTAR